VALERYGLDRFLGDWDEILAEVAGDRRSSRGGLLTYRRKLV
jgi:hypothetical protein